jgi:glycosyltransferase involved in cell wall biosynthesis
LHWKYGTKNVICTMPKLIRVTTVPLALRTLLAGQMRYMREHGFEVIMVSADGPERKEVINNEKCEHHIINMTRAITPFRDIVSLWKLYKLFKKQKPDIVHSHTPKAGLLAMMAAKMAGVPVRIHTVAGLRFVTTGGFKRKLLVKTEKWAYRSAHYVWPNSFSLKQYAEENRLCKKDKLLVVANGSTNGIDLSRFNRGALKAEHLKEIKRKIRHDPAFFYFLFTGRLVKDKGIEELVQAFDRLYIINNKVRLVLAGLLENDLDPVGPATLQKMQTHPAIIQTGWDNQTEYYFALANVFIFPSHREGFPNVLLQAGAMGCPVICSDIPGSQDIIRHEQTGLLFPVSDTDAVFDTMQRALSEQDKMRQWANNLEIKVRSEFSQIFVHQKIEEQYRLYLAKTKSTSNI